MKKVNFLTFFWYKKYGRRYTPAHVDILFRALTEYCDFPFSFYLLTDRSLDVDLEIKQLKLWGDYKSERGCWRRLRAFNRETMSFLPHYFAIDLDVVLFPGFPELVRKVYNNDFTMCLSEHPAFPDSLYSGTMWQVGDLDTVDRLIWQEFQILRDKPENKPIKNLTKNLKSKGYAGSDSALFSYLFKDKDIHNIGSKDGIYSYATKIVAEGLTEPPADTKVVLFNGRKIDYLHSETSSRHKFISNYLEKFNKQKAAINEKG